LINFKRIVKTLDHLVDQISIIFLWISGAMIWIMAFSTTYGSLRRYLFSSPEPYSSEITVYVLTICACFSLAYIEKLNRHIRMDLLSYLFPKETQAFILNVFIPAIGIFFYIILIQSSWDYAMYGLQIGMTSFSSLRWPVYPAMLAIPIGSGMLCLMLIAKIIRYFATWKRGASLKREAVELEK
jgi:TRAP-type transport system small permease protein